MYPTSPCSHGFLLVVLSAKVPDILGGAASLGEVCGLGMNFLAWPRSALLSLLWAGGRRGELSVSSGHHALPARRQDGLSLWDSLPKLLLPHVVYSTATKDN